MKTLKCTDLGNANCNAVFKAESVDEVLKQATEHAKSAHSVVVTSDILEKMKDLVKDEAAPVDAPTSTVPAAGAPTQGSSEPSAPKE